MVAEGDSFPLGGKDGILPRLPRARRELSSKSSGDMPGPLVQFAWGRVHSQDEYPSRPVQPQDDARGVFPSPFGLKP